MPVLACRAMREGARACSQTQRQTDTHAHARTEGGRREKTAERSKLLRGELGTLGGCFLGKIRNPSNASATWVTCKMVGVWALGNWTRRCEQGEITICFLRDSSTWHFKFIAPVKYIKFPPHIPGNICTRLVNWFSNFLHITSSASENKHK